MNAAVAVPVAGPEGPVARGAAAIAASRALVGRLETRLRPRRVKALEARLEEVQARVAADDVHGASLEAAALARDAQALAAELWREVERRGGR